MTNLPALHLARRVCIVVRDGDIPDVDELELDEAINGLGTIVDNIEANNARRAVVTDDFRENTRRLFRQTRRRMAKALKEKTRV